MQLGKMTVQPFIPQTVLPELTTQARFKNRESLKPPFRNLYEGLEKRRFSKPTGINTILKVKLDEHIVEPVREEQTTYAALGGRPSSTLTVPIRTLYAMLEGR